MIRKVAHSISKLNSNEKINIPNNDELGDLANDISEISITLKETVSELQKKNIVLNKDKKTLENLNLELKLIDRKLPNYSFLMLYN